MVEYPDEQNLRQLVATELGNRPAQQNWWIGLRYKLLDFWYWGGSHERVSKYTNFILSKVMTKCNTAKRSNVTSNNTISDSNPSLLIVLYRYGLSRSNLMSSRFSGNLQIWMLINIANVKIAIVKNQTPINTGTFFENFCQLF